jgi:hypothetical protein
MKKIVIPALAIGVMLVAIGFAVQPVERASAVHSTIGGIAAGVGTVTKTDVDFDATDNLSFTCTGGAVVHAIAMDNAGTLAAGDNWDLVVDVDGAGATFSAATTADFFAGVAPADTANILNLAAFAGGAVGIGASGTVNINAAAEAADDGNEIVSARFISQGVGCS